MKLCSQCAEEMREAYEVKVAKRSDGRKKEKCDKCGKLWYPDECTVVVGRGAGDDAPKPV